MIQSDTLEFLRALKENNNKPWFDENRKVYEMAKKDFGQLVHQLIKGVESFDKSVEEAALEVKNCTFRINRDVRFSKNKDPYKTNFGAFISKGSKKINAAGYYIHLEPEACFIAGGLWMTEPDDLKKIRSEIDYHWEEFQSIIDSVDFRENFPRGIDREVATVRPPKGYDESNPAIEYIKLKSFTVSAEVESNRCMQQSFADNMIQKFSTLERLVNFLNRAIES